MGRQITNTRLLPAIWLALSLTLTVAALPAAAALNEDFAQGWTAYESGDYATALTIWTHLAEAGDTNAQLNLGGMYEDGIGVQADPARAAELYRTAAELGSGAAQYNLALLYMHGRGLARDPAQAAIWYRKAAEQDLAVAQYNLGMLYVDGNGVAADANEARRWLARAAEQDHAPAQFNLAALLLSQPGADIEQAFAWLTRSADQYLQDRDPDGARAVAEEMRRHAPADTRLATLDARIRALAGQASKPASVSASRGVSTGTAWPISAGYAVTNNHVVADVETVVLINTRGEEITATVILRDEVNDLAVLSVDNPAQLPPALPLSPGAARLGSSVFTIGYPRIDVMGKSPKLTDGIVSSVNGIQGDPASYQISVPIQPGNSGGPLLNMNGEVVGVITSMLASAGGGTDNANPLPNINYALKVDALRQILPLLPKRPQSLRELPNRNDNLEELASRIQESVMIVMAW